MKSKTMFVYYRPDDLIITMISDRKLIVEGLYLKVVHKNYDREKLLGKRLPKELILMTDFAPKSQSELRIAMVCNWNSQCGISSYSKFLTDAMIPKVKTLKIFSEVAETPVDDVGYDVDRCWKRGESLIPMINKVLDWSPDFIIVQHEYGLFPNAFYFMQMCQHFENRPYVIAMHSIYQHLDKLVYSECVKNIIVHTQAGQDMLKQLGNTSKTFVIPHGCLTFTDTTEIWNICQQPYTIMQFGFGFEYKGVDRAIQAIHHLKTTDPKFKDIMYFYLLSENAFNSNVNYTYYNNLMNKVAELGLEDNISIVKKFQTEQMLNYYLRLAKLAIFPYINNPNNIVFGASGAIRVALANKRPVIASESHLFDDFEGIIPRPKDYLELAKVIDEVFSNDDYRNGIVERGYNYILNNSWDVSALKYLEIYNKIVDN